MRVEANVSDYTTEGVLLVKYRDKKWRPVAFISKSLNVIECMLWNCIRTMTIISPGLIISKW